MIKTVNSSTFHPPDMWQASPDAIKAAKDRGMMVLGVNKSGYFTTESFLMSVDLIAKSYGASPSNPIFFVGDGARPHVTPEVSN